MFGWDYMTMYGWKKAELMPWPLLLLANKMHSRSTRTMCTEPCLIRYLVELKLATGNCYY